MGEYGVQESNVITSILSFFLTLFIYFKAGEGREKERERNINAWLPLLHPLLGTWPTTQARALTGNQTSNLSFRRPALNPLSHTSQGATSIVFKRQ